MASSAELSFLPLVPLHNVFFKGTVQKFEFKSKVEFYITL